MRVREKTDENERETGVNAREMIMRERQVRMRERDENGREMIMTVGTPLGRGNASAFITVKHHCQKTAMTLSEFF